MHSTILQNNDIQPGTPSYQAPEVRVQLQSAKPPADIWSLCCTYVELYSGEEIWDVKLDEDDVSSVDLITNFMRRKELPHGLIHLNAKDNVPSAIKDFIKEGLQYDITLRPTAIKICRVLQELT